MLYDDYVCLSGPIIFCSAIGKGTRFWNTKSMRLTSIASDVAGRSIKMLVRVNSTPEAFVGSQSEDHFVYIHCREEKRKLPFKIQLSSE